MLHEMKPLLLSTMQFWTEVSTELKKTVPADGFVPTKRALPPADEVQEKGRHSGSTNLLPSQVRALRSIAATSVESSSLASM